MPDFLLGFGIVAIVLCVTPLASGLVERSPLSLPVIFLGLGFLLGQRGLDVIQMGAHDPVLEIVATLTLAVVLTAMLVVLKAFRRTALRGVQGELASQAWSEITFGLAGVASLVVGWGWLGDPWLGFLPIAFMAWGDSTAGLARATLWRSNPASVWPSLGMAAVCLGAAFLYQPYWIGAVGAVVATISERKRPRLGVWWDDNAQVVAVSLTTMVILTML